MISKILIPVLVAMGLFAGFGREIVLAYLFGTTREIEIFRVAFGLPNVLCDALAISFVSVLIRLLLADKHGEHQNAVGNAVWATLIFAGGVFILGICTMPLQANVFAPYFVDKEHAQLIDAGKICWFAFLCVVLSLPLRALMSIQGKVWPGASAQFIRSAAFLLSLLALSLIVDLRDITALALSTVFGGAVLLLLHIFSLDRVNRGRIYEALASVPSILVLLPTLSAVGLVLISQLLLSAGRMADRAVASGMVEGMAAALDYSYAIIMGIAAILATSTNLLLAPIIGRSIRDTGSLSRKQRALITMVFIVAAITSFALVTWGKVIVQFVYQRGAFNHEATEITSVIFKLQAYSMGPMVLSLLLIQVLLLHGRQLSVIMAAGAKLTVKIIGLALVVQNSGDIYAIAKTTLWAEVAMAIILLLILSWPTSHRTHTPQ